MFSKMLFFENKCDAHEFGYLVLLVVEAARGYPVAESDGQETAKLDTALHRNSKSSPEH